MCQAESKRTSHVCQVFVSCLSFLLLAECYLVTDSRRFRINRATKSSLFIHSSTHRQFSRNLLVFM
jgi:hypothetical protein